MVLKIKINPLFNLLFPLILLLNLLSYSLFAQSKLDASKKPKEVLKDTLQVKILSTNNVISDFTGWIKNEEDKWISAKNKIPFYENDFNNEYYEKYDVGTENLKKIQITNISILGKPYKVFMMFSLKTYEQKTVEGKDSFMANVAYPAIEYYVLETKEFNLFKSQGLINNKNQCISLKYLYSGFFGYRVATQVNDLLKKKIEYNITDDHQKDGNVVQYLQFVISPKKLKNGAIQGYKFYFGNAFGNLENNALPVCDYKPFELQYYTINPVEWNKFIK